VLDLLDVAVLLVLAELRLTLALIQIDSIVKVLMVPPPFTLRDKLDAVVLSIAIQLLLTDLVLRLTDHLRTLTSAQITFPTFVCVREDFQVSLGV
jgi:hypothetical protein